MRPGSAVAVITVLLLALGATPASAGITFDGSPGTNAPPPTLGGYGMTPFPLDGRREGVSVTSVPSPAGGDVTFDQATTVQRVPTSWTSSWSHGYTGSVYGRTAITSRTLGLPADTKAFYFYTQGNLYLPTTVTATAQDGTTSGPVSVSTGPPGSSGGAKYIGFYATGSDEIGTITVRYPPEALGFAIGEFGIANDSTPPAISITSPGENAVFTLNESVLADYSCSDGESPATKCEGSVADGEALDTTTVGPKSFTVDAESGGGTASKTHLYSVVWATSEFASPIRGRDSEGNLASNATKAGGAVPVKFSLSGDQGLDIFAEGYPRSQSLPCHSNAEVDGVETTTSTGNAGLRYDEASGQYTYVWKTDKAWSGSCRQLVLKLADGTYHRANFEFAK
jgi:hypothetical protein